MIIRRVITQVHASVGVTAVSEQVYALRCTGESSPVRVSEPDCTLW